jgi:hypothetical protein
MEKEIIYDVAVVGAGPAGILAAGEAAKNGLSVVLLEKNKSLAKKLLLTGGGRCNLTNAEANLPNLVKKYNNGEFLYHAFSEFGTKDVINFFEELGVKLKTEKNGRVFPVSNDAQEILDALEKYLAGKKVKMLYGVEVVDVSYSKVLKNLRIDKVILKSGEVTAKNYILATGGRSYPLMGSNGAGYKLAEKLGHTIVKPTPALVPIEIEEEWVKNLKGISLKDVKLTLLCLPVGRQATKKVAQEDGEVLFTHTGISGPAILNISGEVGRLLETEKELKISFDLFPLLNYQELLKGLEDDLKQYPNKSIKNILASFVPEKRVEILLDIAKLNKEKIANNMSKAERAEVVKILKNIEITPTGVLGWDLAKVTKGGISLKEIDHKTMRSKIIKNLSFAGEIIDIDGKSGGFNLQMCWSTGHLAGKNVR